MQNTVHHSSEKKVYSSSQPTPAAVRWELASNYVVDSVLGTFNTSVLRLAPDSCRALGIEEDHLVLLPMEARHARLRQVPVFCRSVMSQRLHMSVAQIQYLMELLEVEVEDLLCDSGLTEDIWATTLNAGEADEHTSIILADYFLEVLDTLTVAEATPQYH